MVPNTQSGPLCPDWVFSDNSDVHAAKDRGWFTEYTPFETEVGDIYRLKQGPTKAVGIGTVEIPTKRSPNRTGIDAHGTLRLTNVLHVPSFICNVIGMPIEDDYKVLPIGSEVSKSSFGSIKDKEDRPVAYFDSTRPLLQVKLRGPPVGPHALTHDGRYMISVRWSDSEREKWRVHQANMAKKKSMTPIGPPTAEEKAWLKMHYGNEFRFLQSFNLSIYKDEEREEGRKFLRAFMLGEEEEDEELEEDSGRESEIMGHAADYNFTPAELKMIKKGWGNSINFIHSFGLKFYNPEDGEEAATIVRALVSQDD